MLEDLFPVGSTVFIDGLPPLTVRRFIPELPGLEMVKDGEHYLTVNPKWLVQIASGVKFPEVAA